ncbi:D-tyrosyl-tRNA(Tyr) deacylase [Candidatus Peregrinibacteria bacterium]|nr:D-tyrosyl-tRNA(Tyr) deacylase [Candidatus Peregrinibacteria bacterium]
MKTVIQKSGPASVEIDRKIYSKIKSGLVILLGIKDTDTVKDIEYLTEKIVNLRIFRKNDKYFEKSLLEEKKEALVISQFTLYAKCKKGRRPDFNEAANGEIAKPLYNQFINKLKDKGIEVRSGIFGAMMKVSLTNEGPVTIILDSNEK